jgi:hypothetical protein
MIGKFHAGPSDYVSHRINELQMRITYFAFVICTIFICLPASAQPAGEQAKLKKTCSDQALDIEFISIKRIDAGVLQATLAITNNANIAYKIYPAQPHVVASLSDNNGDTWRFGRHSVGNTYPPGAKIKSTVDFTRSVGGNEATSATFTIRVALNSNYMNKCSVTFSNVAIE